MLFQANIQLLSSKDSCRQNCGLCLGCSVGAHVRDAAAYVCWAFARAYTAADLADSISVLAPALLVTACYDREVCLQHHVSMTKQC